VVEASPASQSKSEESVFGTVHVTTRDEAGEKVIDLIAMSMARAPTAPQVRSRPGAAELHFHIALGNQTSVIKRE
jgi:hypothetical protein